MRMDNEIIVSKYLKTDKYPKHHNNQKNNIKFMLIYYLTYSVLSTTQEDMKS